MAESGALTEPHMVALREAYQLCKKEYAVRTDKDRGEVIHLFYIYTNVYRYI